ncbi:MAG: PIN domain-containing protein [Planctomycetota bacterium]
MKVFWDTNLFIYLIEEHPTFHPRILSLYQEYRAQGHRIVTSTLTLGELLAQPLRHGRHDLVDRYVALLTAGTSIELVTFDRAAAHHYAAIRAAISVRQPDAIQLACAVAGGATVFLTNDQRLWGVTVPGLESIRGL